MNYSPDTLLPVANMRGMINAPKVLEAQVQAGNSILTFRSRISGQRLTFRFQRPEEKPGQRRPIWVSVLSGPDNERAYTFLGTIWDDGGQKFYYRHSPKSKATPDAPSVKLIEWIVNRLGHHTGLIFEGAEIWHEGRCGRCGRTLTVPESIEHGFGPECIKHVVM